MWRTLGAAARVWGIIVLIWLRRAVRPRGRRAMDEGGSVTDRVRREVLSWPGVSEAPHRFGGIEFRYGRRELGHLHGDYLADLPFPTRVRRDLVAAGRAMPHHILPHSGWVSYPIRDAAAVPGAIDLFRLAYERSVAQSAHQADKENA